jgi:hypothetical protein
MAVRGYDSRIVRRGDLASSEVTDIMNVTNIINHIDVPTNVDFNTHVALTTTAHGMATAISTHAALITGVHGLVITAGQTITVESSSILNQDLTTDAGPTFDHLHLTTDLPVSEGGTGASTFTDGGLLVGAAANAIEALAVGLTTQILVGGGAATNPLWATDIPTAVTIGSKYVYRADGTDISIADGGTGRSTSTTAYGLLAAGTTATGAHQTLAAGATTQILVGGGASALPAWGTDIPTAVTIGSAYIYRAAGTDVAVADGGTNISSYAVGDILYASAATTLSKLADVAVGSYLRSGGVTTAPLWSTLILPNAVTDHCLVVATATNTYGELAAGTTGKIIRGVTGNVPAWTTATYPDTVATGEILHGSAANVVSALAAGATTKILVGGGAAAPVWTEATGSGAPMRGTSPTITTSLLASSAAIFKSDNYASQTTGWGITYAGAGDFRYLFTDELHAKAFIADLEQALAGGQIICKSVSLLGAAFTAPAAGGAVTITVKDLPSAENMAVFESGDYIRIRTFSRAAGSLTIADCWGIVTNYADQADKLQTWTFTRASGGGAGSMAQSTVVAVDSIILDYGVSGNGFYEVNAIDGLYGVNSPYSQVVTWATSPMTQTVRVRQGNLLGLFGTANEYGLYAGTGVTAGDQYIRISNEEVELHNVVLKVYAGSEGYANFTDIPAELADINAGEGSKLTGIASGATVGAAWASNLTGRPTELTDGRISIGLNDTGQVISVVVPTVPIGGTSGVLASTLNAWKHASDTTLIDGGRIFAESVTSYQISCATLSAISADMGTITAGTMTGATIQTATSGRRMRMDADGLACLSGAVGQTYGVAAYKYGDADRHYGYGDGIQLWINNPTKDVPIYEAVATAKASMHFYDRVSNPAGPNEVGDVAIVGTKLVMCISAGSPGTWQVVGAQTA